MFGQITHNYNQATPVWHVATNCNYILHAKTTGLGGNYMLWRRACLMYCKTNNHKITMHSNRDTIYNCTENYKGYHSQVR